MQCEAEMNHGRVAIWTIFVLNWVRVWRDPNFPWVPPPPTPPKKKEKLYIYSFPSRSFRSFSPHARPRLSVSFACKTMSSKCRYSLDLLLFSVCRMINPLWVNDFYLTFQFKKHVNKSILLANFSHFIARRVFECRKSRDKCILGIAYIATYLVSRNSWIILPGYSSAYLHAER